MSKVVLSKLEIAQRQLDAAIEMFFSDGDPVAVHALTASSYEVLTDLLMQSDQEDDLIAMLRPEFRDEFRRRWRAPQNFFKHADRDPNEVLEYETDLAEQFLFMACQRFERLNRCSIPMRVLAAYYFVRHPYVLVDLKVQRAAANAPQWMTHGPRRQFYDEMCEAAYA